jgi:hypothetical protein
MEASGTPVRSQLAREQPAWLGRTLDVRAQLPRWVDEQGLRQSSPSISGGGAGGHGPHFHPRDTTSTGARCSLANSSATVIRLPGPAGATIVRGFRRRPPRKPRLAALRLLVPIRPPTSSASSPTSSPRAVGVISCPGRPDPAGIDHPARAASPYPSQPLYKRSPPHGQHHGF